MKKALRKYFLTISILLLTGYGCLHAISSQDFCRIPKEKTQGISTYFGHCHNAFIQSSITSKAVSRRKENPGIYYEEKEEECAKLFFTRAFEQPCDHLNAFSTKIFRSFFSELKLVLPTCEHWFYASSRRFSILRVMRI